MARSPQLSIYTSTVSGSTQAPLKHILQHSFNLLNNMYNITPRRSIVNSAVHAQVHITRELSTLFIFLSDDY